MVGRTLLDIDLSTVAVVLLANVIRAWLSYRDVGVRQEYRELDERGFSKLESSVF
jgi:hypothetical protein